MRRRRRSVSWAVALLQESLAQSLELALVVPLDELGLEVTTSVGFGFHIDYVMYINYYVGGLTPI